MWAAPAHGWQDGCGAAWERCACTGEQAAPVYAALAVCGKEQTAVANS